MKKNFKKNSQQINRKQLEEELKESVQKYKRIFNSIKEGVISTDKNGTIVIANPAAAEILGYSTPEELVGKRGIELYAYPEQLKKLFEKLIKKGVIKDLELTFKKKDGTLVYLRGSAAIHLDSTGNILQTDSIFRVGTLEKEYERQIQESEEKFRLIAETITEVFWIADVLTNKTFYISPAYEKIWGRSCESLYENPRSFLDAIYPEDLKRVIATMETKKYGQPFNHEYRIIQTEGSIRWIWDQGFPVRDNTGQVTCYVGVAQDITERKEFESKIKLQGEISTNISEGIVLVRTSNSKIVYANPKMNELFGYEPDELIEKNVSILNAPTAKSPEETAKEIIEELRENGIWCGECLGKKKDGSFFWCQFSISRFYDPLLGELWVGMNRDITEKKQMIESLQKSEEESCAKTAELEELNAALNVLLKKRDEEKRLVEQNIIFNIRELIVPYLTKLMNSPLDKQQNTYINILASHLDEILSSFSFRLTSWYHNLTPTEIKIANLIKEGRKTKEIAPLLNSSERAVEFHRNSLRKKFGLKNKKANLRTFLLSLK